jgi:TatD DNase family protein
LNCLISFTGNVTYGDRRDEAIKKISVDKLMIETDAPYLAPEPYRGKKNQPAYVKEVAKYIAKVKKTELSKLEQILQKNTQDFFNI